MTQILGGTMKFFRPLAFAMTLTPIMVLADTISDANERFSQWQPNSIRLDTGGVLRVILPQSRITDSIYYASIQSGFCFGPLLGQNMPEVESVFILNESETQGWLFEGGTAACEHINDAPASGARTIIAGQTSTHTNTASGL
ncbi:hypothetical protein [Yoonia sp. R2-816]|uniref:hypothetical protein n=1 Tax=Yoonia sp. R2-816 TaxID=3342638 RepID=UPI003728C928